MDSPCFWILCGTRSLRFASSRTNLETNRHKDRQIEGRLLSLSCASSEAWESRVSNTETTVRGSILATCDSYCINLC